MIHYHGTPITPRAKLLELAGRCFCVSFAHPQDVQACHQIGQAVMLDNGAFTLWRTGRPTDWPAYYRWCERWLEYRTTWAVIPDVIDGTERENDRPLAAWPFGDHGAPVWHMHERMDRLMRLAQEWPRVCLGSSGSYRNVGGQRWQRRMAEAMDRLCPHGPAPVWLHMLRGMKLAGSRYPFASADSTSIARNHAGVPSLGVPPRSPRAMADKLDRRQCPARWRTLDPTAVQSPQHADQAKLTCQPATTPAAAARTLRSRPGSALIEDDEAHPRQDSGGRDRSRPGSVVSWQDLA